MSRLFYLFLNDLLNSSHTIKVKENERVSILNKFYLKPIIAASYFIGDATI